MSDQPAAARVLIVEDDLDLRTALGDLFTLEKISFALARDGQEALALLADKPLPNVILLDVRMPAINGLEFRRRQLEHPLWSKIPVIVVSADRSIASLSRTMKVDAFLQKPVDIPRLLELIARWP